MSTDDSSSVFYIALILAFFSFVGGCIAGGKHKEFKAVEAGVAEYYLDSNHNKQFRWKTQTQ